MRASRNFELSPPRGDIPFAPESLGLSSEDALNVIARFDPIGLLRASLATGLVYWSGEVFEIFGWDVREGPVDLAAALDALHHDDRGMVSKCMKETVKNKPDFRFILRLFKPDGDYIWVKSCGLYRQKSNGSKEINGHLERFSALTRSATVLS